MEREHSSYGKTYSAMSPKIDVKKKKIDIKKIFNTGQMMRWETINQCEEKKIKLKSAN